MHIRDLTTGILDLLEVEPSSQERIEAIRFLHKNSELSISAFATIYWGACNFYIEKIQRRAARHPGCHLLQIGLHRHLVTNVNGANLYADDFSSLMADLRRAFDVSEKITIPGVIAN